jgi:hypothetical protein
MARLGSLGTQYFDDAGDPLINGKIYIFESGTTTPKDTYADINLSILNPNPILLTAAGRQPNVFFSGSARAVLTKNDDTQVQVIDPIGGEGLEGAFSNWNSLTIYNAPDIVVGSDNKFYVSITDGNQANDPVTNTVNWTEIKFTRVWNENENYIENDIVQASNGAIYRSTVDNNLNNDPVADAVNWTGAVAVSIPAVIRSSSKTFAYRNF